MDLLLQDQSLLPLDRPRIMGILNLTPDSFSDGGQYNHPDQAVEHALAMIEQGADIIDVGGESTRPGAQRVSETEQIDRVVPVIRALRQRLDVDRAPTPISIDTTRVRVARAAVEAGATILNDVSAAREDSEMLTFAAQHNLPIILMHMLGEPATMQQDPTYDDVIAEVRGFLLERAQAAITAGIDPKRIVLDPGIGFGKTTEHNLDLLRSIRSFVDTGYPVLVGASRKRFISAFGNITASPSPSTAPTGNNSGGDRLGGTCAVTAHCVRAGVAILRVHDVAPNRQAADLAHTLSGKI